MRPFEIGLLTQADRVKWSVQDFWKSQVASGETRVVDHYADIQPGKELKGWYLLSIDAEKAGQALASVQTGVLRDYAHRPRIRARLAVRCDDAFRAGLEYRHHAADHQGGYLHDS